jgi:hypothetical protein
VVLPIPAGLDITFRAYAKNGTLSARRSSTSPATSRGGVPILLEPVAANPGTLAVTLPYDERIVLSAIGETDRYTFATDPGANYEVQVGAQPVLAAVGRSPGAGRGRRATRRRRLRHRGLATVVSSGAGGTMSVEVTATAQAPGQLPGADPQGRRQRLRHAAGGDAAADVDRPLPIAAGATLCFNLSRSPATPSTSPHQQFSQTSGVITLLAPDGTAAFSRGYGVGVGTLHTRHRRRPGRHLASADPQQRDDSGTIVGLSFSRLALDGTIDLGGFGELRRHRHHARHYLVRPGGDSVATSSRSTAVRHFASVWPMGGEIDAELTTGRVFAHPPLPCRSWRCRDGRHPRSTSPERDRARGPAARRDFATTSSAAGDVRIWRIDGSAGAQWTAGLASTLSAFR